MRFHGHASIRTACLALALSALAARADDAVVVAPESVGLSGNRLARIGAYLQEQIAAGKLPGAVVLVARRGEIAYFESFGYQDVAARTPMRKDSIFRIHSMTKPWVSVLAMMLLEEGRLQLGDPVSRWFPTFRRMQVIAPEASPPRTFRRAAASGTASAGAAAHRASLATVPAGREITIYDLLRHTSGLTYGLWAENPDVKAAYVNAGIGTVPGSDIRALAPGEVVERLSRVPLVHEPGAAFEYGHSTDVLGLVIEAVEHAPLGAVLERRLFRPLDMTDSGFWVAPGNMFRLAQPLAREPGTGKPVQYLDMSKEPRTHAGGHGGVSTALDYLRFCEMILGGGRRGKTRILSPASVRLMTADQLTGRATVPRDMSTAGSTWGLGFAVRRSDAGNVLGSSGELYWAGAPSGAAFWIDPRQELVIVFLAQATWVDYGEYRKAVKSIVESAVVE